MTETNDKLIAAKEQWAREGRHQSGLPPETETSQRSRLPPGQHQTGGLPVLDLGITPNLSLKDWSLTVGGCVDRPLKWSWEEFMAQPQSEITSDIHCVTTWSSFDNLFVGVSTRHLLELVQPKPEAKFVVFRSYDGYTTNLPLEHFSAKDSLIAHRWNGEPFDKEHGGPVRAIIPQLYFWKSAKWLRHISFLEKDAPGYWEVRGYHNIGDPWTEERYSE